MQEYTLARDSWDRSKVACIYAAHKRVSFFPSPPHHPSWASSQGLMPTFFLPHTPPPPPPLPRALSLSLSLPLASYLPCTLAHSPSRTLAHSTHNLKLQVICTVSFQTIL